MTACQCPTHRPGGAPAAFTLTFQGAAVRAGGATLPGSTWTETACRSCAPGRQDAVRAEGGTLIHAEMLAPEPVGLDALAVAAEAPAAPFSPDWAVHPGEILAELLDDLKLTANLAATALGWPKEWVAQVAVGSHDITNEMAADLARVFGVTPGFWLRMQARYTAWLGRHAEPSRARLDAIAPARREG